MRKKIFEIYKALRHFGVSAEEVRRIANGYEIWINNPEEDIRESYRIVYYHKGILYAMPFLIDALKDKFVGIEINNVVYFAFRKCTYKALISGSLSMPWHCMSHLHLSNAEWKGIADIKMELPTKEEIISMFNVVNGRGMDVLHNCKYLYENVSHLCPSWWINAENNSIDSINGNGRSFPSDEKSFVQPVTHLREGVDFAGKINHYGVPDKETYKVYQKLTASAKH